MIAGSDEPDDCTCTDDQASCRVNGTMTCIALDKVCNERIDCPPYDYTCRKPRLLLCTLC